MDEKKLLHRVQFLAYHLFQTLPEGKEFLRLMKVLHLSTPTFPQPEEAISRHGGPLGWAAFREGQATLIRALEQLGKNYLDKLDAETHNKEIVT